MVATLPVPTVNAEDKKKLEQKFYSMLKIVIDRVYQDGVERFIDVSLNEEKGEVIGYFKDGQKFFSFALNNQGLEYQPLTQPRKDSYLDSFKHGLNGTQVSSIQINYDALEQEHPDLFVVPVEYRQDKKKNCIKPTAYSCGGACINNSKKCRVNGIGVVKPGELNAIARAGKTLGLSQEKAVGEKEEAPKKTIRDLKREAQSRGVYRYSYMTKEQLERAIKTAEDDPRQQERLERTLRRKRKERETDIVNVVKKYVGIKPFWEKKSTLEAGLVIGAMLIGTSMFTYEVLRNRYRGGFYESAETAKARGEGVKVPNVGENVKHVVFCVDGFSDPYTKNRDKQVETALKNDADPEGMGSDKFHYVSIEGNEYTHINGLGLIEPLDGAYRGVEATLRGLESSIIRGRNPQAIELAAQMYAYDQALNYNVDENGRRTKKAIGERVSLNVIGYHEGGQVVDEAMEVFRLMNQQPGQTPDRTAANARVVKLGTLNFGFNNPVAKTSKVDSTGPKTYGRTMTIVSEADAKLPLPRTNPIQINTAKESSLNSYISDSRVMERIRGTFGSDNFGRNLPKPDITPEEKQRQKINSPPATDWKTNDGDPRKEPNFGSNKAADAERLANWWMTQIGVKQTTAKRLANQGADLNIFESIVEQTADDPDRRRQLRNRQERERRKQKREEDKKASKSVESTTENISPSIEPDDTTEEEPRPNIKRKKKTNISVGQDETKKDSYLESFKQFLTKSALDNQLEKVS
jgi:hypothetical protein